jgi:valyl-tRNA synthetase
LGNSPDLLQMIDEEGADAVRFGIMIASPAGNDLMWDKSGNEQGKFFINKIWNALKLVKSLELRVKSEQAVQTNTFAVKWFENRLNEARIEIDEMYRDFRLSEILKKLYSLIWDDFCSWYLEWIKPPMDANIDQSVYKSTIRFFENLMQLLHPFLPFITEEVYHQLKERTDDIIISQLPAINAPDKNILEAGNLLKESITAIRDAKNKNQLKPRDTVKLHIQSASSDTYKQIEEILAKQVSAETISYTQQAIASSITLVVQKDKFFIETTAVLDSASQKTQLQKDLDYLKGFLVSVEKKLGNEKFVQNAKPEVIEVERKKKADAEAKIKVIEESLGAL